MYAFEHYQPTESAARCHLSTLRCSAAFLYSMSSSFWQKTWRVHASDDRIQVSSQPVHAQDMLTGAEGMGSKTGAHSAFGTGMLVNM